MNNKICVTSLFVYPIKSCMEKELKESKVATTGLINDRIFLIINKKNKKFLSMRSHPMMYYIKSDFLFQENEIISVSVPGYDKIFNIDTRINFESYDKSRILKIQIWDIPCEVYPVETENDELNIILSNYLNEEIILVKPFSEREFKNHIDKNKFTGLEKSTDKTYFADLAPFLITTEESFNFINDILIDKGVKSLKMINFRPNIVLSGGDSEFWEGRINKIKINGIIFRRIKPCERCKIPTFDTTIKKFRVSKEPLEVLNEYSYDDKLEAVIFGQNFCIDEETLKNENSNIKIGDEVIIIE